MTLLGYQDYLRKKPVVPVENNISEVIAAIDPPIPDEGPVISSVDVPSYISVCGVDIPSIIGPFACLSREQRWIAESLTVREPPRETLDAIIEAQDATDKLNNATEEELRSIKGIGQKTAEKIIRARPFLTVGNVRQCVSDAVAARIKEWANRRD